MNCIDCIWVLQLDPKDQCKRAGPEIEKCDRYKKAYRKINKKEEIEEKTLKKFETGLVGLIGLLLILMVFIGETIKVTVIEPKIKEYVNYIERERVNEN